MADDQDDQREPAEDDLLPAADIAFEDGEDEAGGEGAAGATGGEEDIDEDVAAQWAAMIDGNEDGEGIDGGEGGGERILNQDEIDSLLGFDLDEATLDDASGIRAIVNSGLVSYERLPMLEIIFDRLVRLLTTSIRNFTSDNVEVSLDNISTMRFGDYLNSVPLPALIGVFKAVEWDNYALMTVDSNLIYSIVDVLLGGRGAPAIRIEGRPYTTIETNLMRRMVGVILDDAEQAFHPLSPVKFDLERMETNPRFAAITREANAAILVKLRIDMEDRGGRVELLLPYATLEPIRDLLLQGFMGEKFGRDAIWENHLASEIYQTKVQLEAVLDEISLSLNDVMNWKVGDTITLNCRPDDSVSLRCEGIPLLSAGMGHVGEHIAMKIRTRLDRREKRSRHGAAQPRNNREAA